MTFKTAEDILNPDSRFADLCVFENGVPRQITIEDHHRALATIGLSGDVPIEVVTAFDRARNTALYAFFDYDLFVVSELQVVGAFELALKHRFIRQGRAVRGTLRTLINSARKEGILPAQAVYSTALSDPIEALLLIRNELSHGTSDTHSPGMALEVLAACAWWIDHIFPA